VYQLLDGVWQRNWLTNNGPLVNELEQKLKQRLQVLHLLFTTNGTIALQFAIKALGLKGEIITTPFSYVATTSSIVWEGCTPVFVDIEPDAFNMDPNKIEAAITSKTSAILATHVYGNPCDVNAIATIARQHNLKVIYDAAHAFGTVYKGKSLFAYGDISTTSFHATKLFHTVEGGGCITADPELAQRIAYMRNFGHDGPERFNGVGINGKNSEFHAAMGLALLPHMEEVIEKRREQWEQYYSLFANSGLQVPVAMEGSKPNRAYFSLLLPDENSCIKVHYELAREGVGTRRYFYPALNSLNYLTTSYDLPVTMNIAPRVLCLPLSHYMQEDDIRMVAAKVFTLLAS
jgi:dTDP-4-amino-4,6-dideoxygalactose transaminase